MDNTSFPRMLDPKGKTLPDSQLLRWKDWFSRYKFTVRHLKGHQNTIADFLSRPTKSLINISEHTLPLYILNISPFLVKMNIDMIATIFPPGFRPNNCVDATEHAKTVLFYWLHLLLQTTQIHPYPKYFDMIYPYLTIPIIRGPIPEELLWYLWALSALHTCAIAFPPFPIYQYLCDSNNEETTLTTLFKMFAPLPFWRGKLYNIIQENNLWTAPPANKKKFFCIFCIFRDYYQPSGGTIKTTNRITLWRTSAFWPRHENFMMNRIGPYLVDQNEPEEDDEAMAHPLDLPYPQDAHPDEIPTPDIPFMIGEFQSAFLQEGISYSQAALAGESQDPNQDIAESSTQPGQDSTNALQLLQRTYLSEDNNNPVPSQEYKHSDDECSSSWRDFFDPNPTYANLDSD